SRCRSSRAAIVAASIFVSVAGVAAFEAFAQSPAPPAAAPAPAAAPLPPGSPMIGRPDNPEAKKLAPVAPPPIAAAPDKLPIDKLKVPAGYKIEVWASGIPNARSLTMSDKGTVFVGSRLQKNVSAVIEKDGKREVKVVATDLYRPNGVA